MISLRAQPISAQEEYKQFSNLHIKTRSKLSFMLDYTKKGSSLIFTEPQEDLKLIEIEGESLFYVETENGNIVEFLFQRNGCFDFAMQNRIDNYNAIAENNKDTSIYIYQITNS